MTFSNVEEELFYTALLIRRAEEKVIELYPHDKIQSPVHLSIGQEAVAVGVCKALTKVDMLFSTYRSHAFYLAKGGNLNTFFAELYGKLTGCGKGKAGSMHLLAPEVGMMPVSAVVASTIPHAVGAALAAKRLKQDNIAVAVFGDGAVEEGVFHESVNFAAVAGLPVLFICENNGLAVHSHRQARQSFEIRDLVKAYGIPFSHCEAGHDAKKVMEMTAQLTRETRETKTPRFLEIQTCRYKEHVGTGEDLHIGYRSAGDIEKWKAKDPLILRKDLVSKFDPMILGQIEDAVQFAEKSPWPGEDELLSDVI